MDDWSHIMSSQVKSSQVNILIFKVPKWQLHYLNAARADFSRFTSSADNERRRFSLYISGFSATSGGISISSNFVKYFLGKSAKQAISTYLEPVSLYDEWRLMDVQRIHNGTVQKITEEVSAYSKDDAQTFIWQ